MATKTVPTLETVERLVDEVEEWSGRVLTNAQEAQSGEARKRSLSGQLFADLSVELDWLKMKAEVAADAIDEYQESLPEDD